MSRPLLSLCAVLLAATPAVSARAQPPVTSEGCSEELGPQLDARLRVELGAASDDVRLALARGAITVALVCEPDAAIVRVRGASALEQRVEGEPLRELRRIAIAVVELSEAALPPPLPPGSPPPSAAPAARPAWIGIEGGVSVAGVPPLVLGAVGIVAEVPLPEPLALVIDVEGGIGRVTVPAGSIDAGVLSLGASLRFGGWLGVVELGAGPALRGGLVVFVGAASDAGSAGHTHVGPWLGVGAAGGVGVRLGDWVRVGLDVEGGGALLGTGALANGALAARFGDFWLDARGTVALLLP